MTSARNVPRSMRRSSPLWSLPFLAAIALAACGGKVVVDASNSGGGGGTTETSASVQPTTGSTMPVTCEQAIAHLNSCVSTTSGPVPPPDDCQGLTICQSACILAASCEGLLGIDIEASNKFADCINACQ